MKWHYLLLLILMIPIVIGAGKILPSTYLLRQSTVILGGNGTFDLNVSGDSGTGNIIDNEILSILGINGISTSMSGNTLTITKTNESLPITDTNESARVNEITNANCTGTDKAVGFYDNGTIICGADVDTDTVYDDSNVRQSIEDNITYHEGNFKHGNTSAEITGLFSCSDGNCSFSSGVLTLSLSAFKTWFLGNGFDLSSTIQGWINANWTDLENRKLNISDQRFNESSLIPTSTKNLTNDDGYINFTHVTNGTVQLNITAQSCSAGEAFTAHADGTFTCTAISGGGANDGFFINWTPVKTTGNITNGSLSGYPAANAICATYYPGSHMCTIDEILNTINQNKSNQNFTATFRASEGAPGYLAEAYDCSGWTNPDGTALGSIWVGSTTHANTYGTGSLVACNAERNIGCCG